MYNPNDYCLDDNLKRKRIYLTIDEAWGVAKRRMDRVENLTLRVYSCPECGNYHLTSKPKRRVYHGEPDMDSRSIR